MGRRNRKRPDFQTCDKEGSAGSSQQGTRGFHCLFSLLFSTAYINFINMPGIAMAPITNAPMEAGQPNRTSSLLDTQRARSTTGGGALIGAANQGKAGVLAPICSAALNLSSLGVDLVSRDGHCKACADERLHAR
jgi:hypothetical protein